MSSSKTGSPYKFLPDRLVPKEDLLSLVEAACWAPSSYNEQPWRFIIASKEQTDEFEKLFRLTSPKYPLFILYPAAALQ